MARTRHCRKLIPQGFHLKIKHIFAVFDQDSLEKSRKCINLSWPMTEPLVSIKSFEKKSEVIED